MRVGIAIAADVSDSGDRIAERGNGEQGCIQGRFYPTNNQKDETTHRCNRCKQPRMVTRRGGMRSGQALGVCKQGTVRGADYKDKGRSASQGWHIAEICRG